MEENGDWCIVRMCPSCCTHFCHCDEDDILTASTTFIYPNTSGSASKGRGIENPHGTNPNGGHVDDDDVVFTVPGDSVPIYKDDDDDDDNEEDDDDDAQEDKDDEAAKDDDIMEEGS